MLFNYLKTALRNLIRYKGYALINLFGLAIGMGSVILIMFFVRQEISFDQFHKNKERIYRINYSATSPQTGEQRVRAAGPYRLAKELKVDFPDIPHIVRFAPQNRQLVRHQDRSFYEERLAFVDPDVFEVFTFPLLAGDPQSVLDEPFSVVINQETARRYFGNEEALGKALTFLDRDFKVTGLLGDLQGNSQFEFDILVSMNSADQVFSRIVLENWGEITSETFVMLPEGSDPADFKERLASFVDAKLQPSTRSSPQLQLQPLDQLHLYSRDIMTFSPGGDITYVYAFSAIALFILLIACINFMNLATARSANRAREVGLRKVVGAHRSQLVVQFISESILLSVLSLIMALVFVMLCLPAFNGLAGTELQFDVFKSIPAGIGLILITLFVGVVAGSYPALFLSAFMPIQVLSGVLSKGARAGLLRKVLVSFQFAISIFLMVVTGIVYNQLQYTQNVRLGFDKNQLVVLPDTPTSMRQYYQQFTGDLLNHPNIVSAGASSRVPPGRLRSSIRTRPEGIPEDQQEGMQTVWTDFGFIETMGFELAAGRSFSRDHQTDATNAFILNEAAVQKLGWTNENAIGRSFGSSEINDWDSGQWEERNGHVIGVLKDFHFESLHQKIVPTVYFISPYMAWNYVIRLRPDDIPGTLNFIEEKWTALNPQEPFIYTFVDENFAELYRTEERQGKIFGVFCLLAILVACLGLIGLASFTAEQRTKEIGIRKVLGATVSSVIVLISKEFTWLVLVAFVIASPIAWYIMDGWLSAFAYHAEPGMVIFLGAGLFALVVAWLTVGYHATRVALTNPSNALKYQ